VHSAASYTAPNAAMVCPCGTVSKIGHGDRNAKATLGVVFYRFGSMVGGGDGRCEVAVCVRLALSASLYLPFGHPTTRPAPQRRIQKTRIAPHISL